MGIELGGNDKRIKPAMNITPLVDVVLVLLIKPAKNLQVE